MAKPEITLPFSLLPDSKQWKVGKKYRVQLVLKQTSLGQNAATFDVVDALSLELADEQKHKFLSTDGGLYKPT